MPFLFFSCFTTKSQLIMVKSHSFIYNVYRKTNERCILEIRINDDINSSINVVLCFFFREKKKKEKL
jgi:hypothetical protein